GHSCHLFNDRYMFVTYGFTFERSGAVFRNELYILDTSNYNWITRFEQSSYNETPSSNNLLLIGFLIVTSILATALAAILTA
ncbi:5150_t:CDS:2, partial [Racocetra persica]